MLSLIRIWRLEIFQNTKAGKESWKNAFLRSLLNETHMKLIVFDMDGVIFKSTNFWLELHRKFGTYEEGKVLTEKYLYTDYPKLVDEVVGRLWKGRDARPFFELIDELEYTEGVKECISELKERGFKTAIISSGEKHLALRAQKELGIDYIFTNELVIKNKKITGDFIWPVGADSKHVILRQLCEKLGITEKDVIFVGHDESDLKIAKVVSDAGGLVIGFMPEENFMNLADEIIEIDDLWKIVNIIENSK